MSRFDAFAKSRASGRGWFGAWRSSHSDAAPDVDTSRRDLLKRAGLVGSAAVVASTLIQSVTAPAVAVSGVCTGTNARDTCGGTCPPCPPGEGCAQDVDCEPGAYCNGTCQAVPVPLKANLAPCVSDRQCVSFYCNSTTHKCDASPGGVQRGQPCHAANQAAANAQCAGFGGMCVNGTCKVGQNAFCSRDSDCAAPFYCSATRSNTCQLPP